MVVPSARAAAHPARSWWSRGWAPGTAQTRASAAACGCQVECACAHVLVKGQRSLGCQMQMPAKHHALQTQAFAALALQMNSTMRCMCASGGPCAPGPAVVPRQVLVLLQARVGVGRQHLAVRKHCQAYLNRTQFDLVYLRVGGHQAADNLLVYMHTVWQAQGRGLSASPLTPLPSVAMSSASRSAMSWPLICVCEKCDHVCCVCELQVVQKIVSAKCFPVAVQGGCWSLHAG